MPTTPITTEYRTNFLPPAGNTRGLLPAFYGSAPHSKSVDNNASSIKRRLGAHRLSGENTLMEQWINRTKARHFGAFRESYPDPSPFSSAADAGLTLPKLHSSKAEEALSEEEKFRRTYSVLLKRLKSRKANAEALNGKLPGGGKGPWKHIHESYGAGSTLLSWVNGERSLEDSGAIKKIESRPEKPCGGKGPNRHVIDSYGAGQNVIAWISGMPERENRFSSCLPMLPTMHQEERIGGNHALIGGQMRRPDVRGLRDWYM